MATWHGPPEPTFPRLTLMQCLRLTVRAIGLILLILISFPVYWLGLALEMAIPRLGLSTAMIWVFCVVGSRLLGLEVKVEGTPMAHPGARVANHSTWLDIFSFRTAAQIYFVAKSEVARWPVVGFIARNTGTMFIARKRTDAKRQEQQFLERLKKGDRLCFFPEGTSTDGLRVLPFKSSLFAAFTAPDVAEIAWIQPMTAVYQPAAHLPDNFYGWWGDMNFAGHVAQVLGRSVAGQVRVIFHPPVQAKTFENRKDLAAHCEQAVRAPLDAAMVARNVTVPVGLTPNSANPEAP